ncbi:MAG: hypothetical protein CL524_08310 [Aequorivita sp.]|nr:hypothetical protein [Aequorivita sp.]|tara:strand:+ start:3287 stop:4162 length:876 start_codon:yes stop_codon:yes gene_type:complete
MTVQIFEKLDGTRTGSIDASSGTRTLTKNYFVTGTNDINVAIAKVDTEVPLFTTTQIGTSHNGVQSFNVYARYYGTRSWTLLQGETEGWDFALTFSTAPDAGQGIPDEEGGGDNVEWIATQGDTRATTKAVYRAESSSFVPTEVNNPSVALDIGGKKIDSGGTPTTVTAIDRRFNTTHKLIDFPAIQAFSDLVGMRNNDAFDGAPKGTVLYLGFSWAYDQGSGLWVVTHQFAVDKKTFHAEQVAKTDPQGDVIPDKENIEGEEMWRAKHVYWVQPFEMGDFDPLPQFAEGG